MSKYPAHEALEKRGTHIIRDDLDEPVVKNEAIIEEFNQLLASYNALREAVVILPDGALAIEGDVVKGNSGYDLSAWVMRGNAVDENHQKVIGYDIIQRNGKPCIPESDLIKVGGE